MAYLKPPWFTRTIFNKIAMATGIGGSQTLTVTKRLSRQPQKIPVVVPEVDGVKYLVSTRGEAEWVKNVRAVPDVIVGDQRYVASEIPVAQRARVIAAYRPLAGKVVEGYWRQLPDDADHPVFVLTPKG
ncbi:nitroreductase/quinone reductase family protein [Mycobacterium sp. 29Ha]|uniref:nitroreductase/quinone reductase family protein n=1 Tax=Mycobacterium sp. 29Ha TaxID=2939268 RepID=UPI0029390E6D|nr:nitroreductase/quinone reductase family protein [Mycobacterium sp. 29Ha]MDV3133984.1 nitroreductase/quinone reductase family protein [Mycobacterium sp. 29Ha]